MATDTDKKTDGNADLKSPNPADKLYEQEFNPQQLSTKNHEKLSDAERAADDQALAGIAAANDFNYSRSSGKSSRVDRAKQWWGSLSGKQKAGGGIAGVLISLLLGAATFSPFGMLVHLKEIATDWGDKYNRTAYHSRMKKLYQDRYFSADKCTSPIKIKCRLTPKIGEKELQALKDRGLDPKTDSKGRITSMGDPLDNKTRITGANFADFYKNKPHFVAALNNATASPSSVSLRGPSFLKKLINLYRVNRKAPLGDAKDEKGLVKEMRTTQYTDKNAPSRYGENLDTGTEPAVDPEAEEKVKEAIDDLDGSLSEQAAELQEKAVETGVPANSVVDGGLDPEAAASRITKGTLGGAIKGPIGFLDSACMVRRMGITFSIAVKLYQARALIKYAAIFMTIADAAKAGDVTAEQMSLLGTILVRPSVQESSKGKTVSESALVTLITAGAIGSYATAKRFANGNTFTRTIDRFINFVGGGGASVCKKVESWYGQLGMIITGVGACIITIGGSCVAGAIKGTIIGAAMALIIGQLTPQLVHLLAGTVSPDPLNDPEGGYGAGNAIAAGIGALALSGAGRSNGLMPMKRKEFAAADMEASRTMAYLDTVRSINNPGLFNPDNPHSLSRQFATSFAPQLLALQSANVSAITSSFTSLLGQAPQLLGKSASTAFTPAFAAAGDNKYRGELCTDPDIEELELATDAFCNVIYYNQTEVLEGEQYEPEKVIDYMVDHDHVTPEGDVKSDKFKKYLEMCVNGDQPITPNEDVDNTCLKPRDETDHIFFRLYVMDDNFLDSMDQVEKGTFGQGEANNAAPPVTDANPPSADGWVWPAAMPIHDGPCFGGPRAHAGMDINTTSANNPALAMHAGKVAKVGSGGDSGNYIIVQTPDNLFYGYQHLKNKPNFAVGAPVTAGQQLGIIGRTGNMQLAPTTKGHLHITLSSRNKLGAYGSLADMIDPMTVLKSPAPGGYKCENR